MYILHRDNAFKQVASLIFMTTKDKGRIPTLHIVANSIPEAYFKAMKKVWEKGITIRTQYDRKDSAGNYIDPPSRDARVLVEVKNPFTQPRYPPITFCEIGKYIAEILGVKDHLVVPFEKLREGIESGVIDTKWPYTYFKRFTKYPLQNGSTINQVEQVLKRVAETPYTRRAVATTRIPEIDPFLKEDLPCFGEFQLRMPEDSRGNYVLNMTTCWRSRDLFKAWQDNVIAVTFWQQVMAKQLEEMTGRKVKVGSYADFSYSLHIYGQDFSSVGGDSEKGIEGFFENINLKNIKQKSRTSEYMRDTLIIPQLEELINEEYWNFPPETKTMMRNLISDIKTGRYIP